GLEDVLKQTVPVEVVADATRGDAGRRRDGGAGQQGQGDGVAGGGLLADHLQREHGVAGLEQVEDARHQNTMKRRPWRRSVPISARDTFTIGWPLSFQSGSAGIASASTWNGTS